MFVRTGNTPAGSFMARAGGNNALLSSHPKQREQESQRVRAWPEFACSIGEESPILQNSFLLMQS